MRTFMMAALAVLMAGAAFAADIISATKVREAALAGEVTLVDIRTPQEWAATGVPDVAHALDMTEESFIRKLLELQQAHPDRPLAMICATGGRSTYVTTALEQRGMTGLLNVSEGMAGSKHGPGWLARSLPVRKASAPPAVQ